MVSAHLHHAMTTHTSEAYASGGAQGFNSPPLDLFAGEEGKKTVAQVHSELPPHERAMRAIERVLLAGHVLLCAFSSGKDSSCVANLMLNAAINIIGAGHLCTAVVTVALRLATLTRRRVHPLMRAGSC